MPRIVTPRCPSAGGHVLGWGGRGIRPPPGRRGNLHPLGSQPMILAPPTRTSIVNRGPRSHWTVLPGLHGPQPLLCPCSRAAKAKRISRRPRAPLDNTRRQCMLSGTARDHHSRRPLENGSAAAASQDQGRCVPSGR